MSTEAVQACPRLRGAIWARGLDGEQLARVERDTRIQRFAAGTVICHEGHRAEHWIGVLDGLVKVSTSLSDGRTTTFIGVTSGGWLGEGSLLKRELRPYEVLALRDSTIALMPHSTFDWLYRTSLPFNHFLVGQLNARLGQFVSLIESNRMRTTVGQVATALAELFNPALCPGSPELVRISQEEIARLCGLSRAITNRALHQLAGAGLVRVHYKGIHVLNPAGLQAFAQSDRQQARSNA